NLVKAIEILEPIDKQYPDHPGVTHYLIHSYDFPALADRGVPAANKYAKIAPAAPHAQHMPAHIYSMVGMWDASIASNLASVAAARKHPEKSKLYWRGAAQLKPLGSDIPPAEAVIYFARALGAARSGDVAAAQADVAKLIEIRAGLEKANQSYWAGQVEIQVLA